MGSDFLGSCEWHRGGLVFWSFVRDVALQHRPDGSGTGDLVALSKRVDAPRQSEVNVGLQLDVALALNSEGIGYRIEPRSVDRSFLSLPHIDF